MEGRTPWELAWKDLSRRIGIWNTTADAFLRHLEHMPSETMQDAANRALNREAGLIVDAILALELPPALAAIRDDVIQTLGSVFDMTQGRHVVVPRWLVLSAFRAPLDEALLKSEEPRRRLVDRAFLHLNRTLSVDEDAQRRWQTAFEHETRCEKLGALHLLSHGIYAFKADAGSGRTDLILGAPVSLTAEVQAADAMVLTEWKLLRPGEDAHAKAREGKAQAERYIRVELAGFELQAHRYVVLVSREPVSALAAEVEGGITFHYVNIVIDRATASAESRQAARRGARAGRRPSAARRGRQ